MNGAPDWQDGELCFRCRTQFTLVARKHHCRNCGNIFCAKCSSQQIPLPKLNIDKNVRVCDTCYEKITNKSADPLELALDSKDKEQTRTKTPASSSSIKSATSATSSSSNKQNASAPSEQELKEEEELQLALALSLSETPTKVSFPDYRHLEEPVPSSSSTQAAAPVQTKSVTVTSNPTTAHQSITNGISPQRGSIQQSPNISKAQAPSTVVNQYSLDPMPSIQQMTQVIQQPVQPQPDYQIQGRDLDVFKYVGEIHSTLEVFNNRLESCKLRNRPVANDAAIQSLFLKLNSEYQPKLTEYIKTYEEERAYYERLQDKLSQIADARAALDDLRQEHQEKVRQEAAEAERQRQSQLASKLEAMRQKKSQMMQYQRDLALQRIREQEMMLQQQQQQPPASAATASQMYQTPSSVAAPPHYTVSGQVSSDQPQTHDPMHSTMVHQQPPATAAHDWPNHSQQSQYYMGYVPTSQQAQHYQPTQQQSTALQQHQQPPTTQIATHPPQPTYVPPPPPPPPQPVIDRASLAQLERQFLPNTKPDEELLISFDD